LCLHQLLLVWVNAGLMLIRAALLHFFALCSHSLYQAFHFRRLACSSSLLRVAFLYLVSPAPIAFAKRIDFGSGSRRGCSRYVADTRLYT
jgi:hypothetical protein